MEISTKNWLFLSFAAVFFALGLCYWAIPYGALNLPDALLTQGLLVASGAAFLLCAFTPASFWKVVKTLVAAVLAVIAVRVLADCLRDSSAHNLWPFEMIIGAATGIAAVAPGAVLGLIVKKFLKPSAGGGQRG